MKGVLRFGAVAEGFTWREVGLMAADPDTGAEVVTGSTRLKAGTAQKLVLNMLSMRRLIPQKPAFLRNLLRSLLPALLMGAAVLGVSWVLKQFTSSTLILCALPVMVGVAVYAVLIAVFKSVTREDCLLLPKGDKIAKLLRL